LAGGMDDYLSKPIDFAMLRDRLQRFLIPGYCSHRVVKVNPSILNELGGISEEVYRNLIKEFISEINNNLVEFKQKLSENNTKDMAAIMHAIKGASANLRLYSLEGIAENIETKVKQTGIIADINEQVSIMEKELKIIENDFC